MRAVVDTNVLLAGLLNAEGGAAKIIRHFRDGAFELLVTAEIFYEYARVIHLFDNAVPFDQSEELLDLVFERAVKTGTTPSTGLCKDPDDEKFLAAAVAGGAGFLVTKNKRHFPGSLSRTRVVRVREFLVEIERRAASGSG